jgi:phage terminase large subunit-like protein
MPFAPRPWQQQIIRELFGRMRTSDPTRRAYRTCYIEIPRKNGKSELAAALALYGLVGDGVVGAEVYSCAADKDQAALVFNVAAQMVRNEPALDKDQGGRLKIIDSQKRIVDQRTGSLYRAISAEAYSKHGFNASMVIYDELHAAPTRELWDVMSTSMGTRSEPLMIAITTAGYDRHSICWEQHDYALKVLGGQKDETFYPVIYAAPDHADWTDEAVWRAANPALEDFRDIDEMRALAVKAKEIPALQNTFRRLYLNQWTEQSERWIDMAAWDKCAGEVGWKELREQMKGRKCVAGLDLSSRIDLTALVLLFEESDETYTALPFFWVPEEGARKRSERDRRPYLDWIRAGAITATPGSVVDQGFIRKDLLRLANEYGIRELAFDPWNATKLSVELVDDGLNVVELRQGFPTLSEPTKDLGAMVMSRNLRHGGHPVLRDHASNTVVRQDPNGNLAPDKSKVTERMDGIVALIMAVRAAMLTQDHEPNYEVMFFGGR